VRDCLHARDLVPLVARQMQKPDAKVPRIMNVSGGIQQSASLRQLSAWCEERFGKMELAADKTNRPFDVPWLVLDSSAAQSAWKWKPEIPLHSIWEEIAVHAENNPEWLEKTVD